MPNYEQTFSDFKKGEISSFYEKMYPELLIYTFRLLGEEFSFLSEDCVQDAIFQAYNRHHSFSSTIQWKVFLYSCVRNSAISILRKGQAKNNYLTTQEQSIDEDFTLYLIEQETLTLLYEAIDALPEKYKRIFELSFEKGLKNTEVAKQLCIAESTLKKQKARFIELLRANLKDKIDENNLFLLMLVLTEGNLHIHLHT